ncbi:hypothetical protein CTA2_285 [Colletotrichum tanaceti]|uniref:Uncharacterized protein n=1 Tax=Colletotrichum tanaceti TaxID=1306861 RepID=A0A4U6XG80_9PEZI|nr:hypothetical protein CTA2_280 [Colletotrichum tanaceti]KAJ0167770.1 hypothetical protein CTA2_285 [Colletotrichum tanaceti]TKW54890.1 hypothetical protein CTA1_5558 [Colletotrichum tanaceti]
MQMFMECFAAQTRKTMFSCPSSQALDETRISKRVVDNKPTLGDLLTACPEFVLQWDPLGPATTNPSPPAGQNPGPDGDLFLGEVSEVTFLTSWAKLQELRRLVATRGTCRGSPSETDCFTALIWAHATMARMRVRSPGDGIRFSPGTEARLLAPVNWRGHAFNHETRNFFGNTTAYPVTRVPLKEVVDAAEDMDLLAHLASSISAMAEAVDEDFVATQTALMRACPDIRHLGTNICLENPTGFSVDSWRSIGEGLSWGISGILTSKADVVRPVHATNGDGTALILPTTDLSDYHVSVTLQPQAMEVLCNNPGWRQWFHGVIR